MWLPEKKITIVCGHYGSGKTNLAVNLALSLAKAGEKTVLVDLDIVNPYFRAADNRRELEENGVRCVLPQFANTNVDLPSLPPQIHSVFVGNEKVIFDVGGDSLKAIELISKHLRGACENTPEGREGMALAQYVAGQGFSTEPSGFRHCLPRSHWQISLHQ